MRKPIDPQLQLGEIDISSIQFDPRSRDDIPRLLRGLQHLYINPELRQAVFAELGKIIPDNIDKNNGRPGMDLMTNIATACRPCWITSLILRRKSSTASARLPSMQGMNW